MKIIIWLIKQFVIYHILILIIFYIFNLIKSEFKEEVEQDNDVKLY